MIAYRLVEPQEPPQLQDVAKPSPGPGQLLIKVGGCGLCHTDIGLMARTKEQWFNTPPPFTLGHEIAGWVGEIGQGVVGFKSGEPVAVVPVWGSCGHCPPCRRGEENGDCVLLGQRQTQTEDLLGRRDHRLQEGPQVS